MQDSQESSNQTTDCKIYLDYIDKEMTLCGIITTFCLACILFMIDKMFSKPSPLPIINYQSSFFITSLVLFFISAFLLFKQRADLAFHFGQISFENTFPGYTDKTVKKWFNAVDAWKFWYPYFYGIALIMIAFIEIAFFIYITLFGSKNSEILEYLLIKHSIWSSLAIVVIGLIVAYLYIKRVTKEIIPSKLPHYKVYTRIAVSNVHKGGVGIIAIMDIPKDEYIFYPDDDQIVTIPQKEIEDLPDEIKKLYNDFCVKQGNLYQCPVSFNKLSPAWYLNNSETPNVYCDENIVFKALRDIKAGEELTATYSEYSD